MAKTGKFVLMIGDEGGILTYFQGEQVIKRLYAPTPNYTDTRIFLELIEQDKKAPIYLLVDTMDQSYTQQSLPPVSALSVNKLIKRKLDRDFAADDLKGALPIGREKAGRRDWKFLFVTLSQSQQLQSWVDFLIELPNQFKGIYLVPVEGEPFLHRLREAVTGKSFKPSKKKEEAQASDTVKWQLLVAHNKVGGFRQLVLKEGKLMFARLAQPIGDSTPDVIAGSIEQEISVTIEYLKRLGYSEDQGMEVYIIASEAIKASIAVANINAGQVHIFSPHQAALQIGLDKVTEPTDQFADGVFTAAFVTAKRHFLRLEAKQTIRINKLYNSIMAVQVGGVVGAVALVIALVYFSISIPLTNQKIQDEKNRIRGTQDELEELKELEKRLPDDLETITDLVSIHQTLNQKWPSPLDSLEKYLSTTQTAKMLLSKFEWELEGDVLSKSVTTGSPTDGSAPPSGEPAPKNTSAAFDIEFFETQRGTNGFNALMDEYLALLQKTFENYKILMTTQKPGISEEQKKVITLTGEDRDPLLEQKSLIMRFTVEGNGLAPPNVANTSPVDMGL